MADPEVEHGLEMPVGQYLRSVREAGSLQLEDAARVTKIGKNYLVAIEEGEFDKLPNAAYIKGFLRLYASFLGLSGDDVVARYERTLPPAPRSNAEANSPHPGIENMEKSRLQGHGRWIVPALLLVVVAVLALFYPQGEEQAPAPPQPPQQPQAAPPVLAPVTAPVQRPQSSARLQPLAAPGVVPSAPAVHPAGKASGIVLRLRFNRDSWLSITIDDSISQRYDLKAGDIIEWKGSRLFVLDLGDGGAVEAEFNGKPLKALGEPGQPAHVELKGDS